MASKIVLKENCDQQRTKKQNTEGGKANKIHKSDSSASLGEEFHVKGSPSFMQKDHAHEEQNFFK